MISTGRRRRCIADALRRAAKGSLLAQKDSELLFEWLAAEYCIEGLTARHAIVFGIGAAIGRRDKVLNTRIGLGQGLAAKETCAALDEK